MLNIANTAIKKMNLRMLMMYAAVLRIERDRIEYSSAGMPPLLIYRNESREVEQFVLKAMPLGAFEKFPYAKIESPVSSGDIIIMASDGLTGLFNENKEMLGTDRIIETLKLNSAHTADEIIGNIFKMCYSWSGNNPLNDDITIVVIKIRCTNLHAARFRYLTF